MDQTHTPAARARWTRRLGVALGVAVAIGAAFALWKRSPPAPGPLDKAASGAPDFRLDAAAVGTPQIPDSVSGLVRTLNERLAAGIEPDENAAVLLVEAFGLPPTPAADQDVYLQMLGMQRPRQNYGFLLDPATFLGWSERSSAGADFDERLRQFRREIDNTRDTPWDIDRHPLVAKWLVVNAELLALVHLAVERPAYYQPMLPPLDRPRLLDVQLHLESKARTASQLLQARAMLRLKRNEVPGAWDDVVTCYRLGRFAGRGPHGMSQLVAAEIEHGAYWAAVEILRAETPTEVTNATLQDLLRLKDVTEPADVLDFGERLTLQDAMMRMDEVTPQLGVIQSFLEELQGQPLYRPEMAWASMSVEIDRLVEVLQSPAYPQQQSAFADWSLYFDGLRETVLADRPAIAERWQDGDHEGVDRWVGQLLAVLLMPKMDSIFRMAAQRMTELELLKTALALRVYRHEHGAYPESLAELVPAHLPAVPRDAFAGEPLRYETRQVDGRPRQGIVLYSVWYDLDDDGGLKGSSENGDLAIELW